MPLDSKWKCYFSPITLRCKWNLEILEPVSHFFYSDRLKLQFWDWGTDGKPAMILVHGGLDHARSWDWVARALRDDYHVYALDLRGHGNSAWAPGALYSIAEHVLDLSALADIINAFPVYIIGHSLGGILTLLYAGVYPDRVKKMVAIEGLGPPPNHRVHKPASERMRDWIEARTQAGASHAAQLSGSGDRGRADEGGEPVSYR